MKTTITTATVTKTMLLATLLAIPTWTAAILSRRVPMTVMALGLSCLAGGLAITVTTLLRPVWKSLMKSLTITLVCLLALACATASISLTPITAAILSAILLTFIPGVTGSILAILAFNTLAMDISKRN